MLLLCKSDVITQKQQCFYDLKALLFQSALYVADFQYNCKAE